MHTVTLSTPQERAAGERWTKPVRWYRSPLDAQLRNQLHARSDLRGALQALGYLGVLMTTGSIAFYSAGRWPWWATVLLTFLHGTCYAFQINAVHELGHRTVFRTPALNNFFQPVFAFLGWINHVWFNASHARHHQFTLHPPDDLEVVLPIRYTLRQFLLTGFVDPTYIRRVVGEAIRIARARFEGDWELALFPANDDARRAPIRWSQFMLAGHGLIILGAVIAATNGHPRMLMLPLLTTFGRCYGGWLFFSCNNTQHVGMQQNVADFRLCCRSFTLNPVVRFLYWHMNFHVEHHMYAQVPCYRLTRLHAAIRHDLPPSPRGILAVWREIAKSMAVTALDATRHTPPAPRNAGGLRTR